ncbi:MAG TPA: type II toxin-antitoxin system mRNA interferase toxin, RelE/StbE family [Candidatus Omnitrophica bacterium]|nr:type II toxin-antitoxin system mRNA interferase toxin, RelE/StbE family [Candidatus Omnitrophota bacterium]
MLWKVKLHRLVLEEDFKRIDKTQQLKIIRAIKSKLSKAPNKYGRQLSGQLSKYRRLRVEDYRVIYEVLKDKVKVHVIKIGIRRDFEVYREIIRRLKKMS